MTKYSDATSMTRALLCRLRVDVRATEKDTDLAGIDPTLVFPGGHWFLVGTLGAGYYEYMDANGGGPAGSSQDGRDDGPSVRRKNTFGTSRLA